MSTTTDKGSCAECRSFDKQFVFDYRDIDNAYSRFKTLTAFDEKQKWANELIRLVSIQTSVEETVIYPVMEQKLGKVVTDHLREEHLRIKTLLNEVDKMDINEVSFREKLDLIMQDLTTHAKNEEEEYLPNLVSKLNSADINSLTEKYDNAKKSAPTHPHPSAPNKGDWKQTITSAPAAIFDKATDTTKEFPSEASKRLNREEVNRSQTVNKDKPSSTDMI